jgi:RimJ/RimL family protein N-acetyltransferase
LTEGRNRAIRGSGAEAHSPGEEQSLSVEPDSARDQGSVALAPLTAADSPALLDWINDRDLVVLNSPFRPVSAAQHSEWFDDIQRRADTVFLGIRIEPAGELIGTVQLHSIHPIHRSAELQIRIAKPSYRGRGYGSTAVRLALRLAFEDLNLNRLSLHVFSDNLRAIRTYEKAGFVREGLLRDAAFIGGAYVDVVVMGILRKERRDTH